MNWNGKEFVNQDDHGRELQSASSFDNLGECYNPTEAGSEADGAGDTSASKLLYFNTSGNKIMSSTQMAFWAGANQPYPAGCGIDKNIKVAQNTTNLSNHILTKQVTIGFPVFPTLLSTWSPFMCRIITPPPLLKASPAILRGIFLPSGPSILLHNH